MLVPYMLGIDNSLQDLSRLLIYFFPGCFIAVDLCYKNESNISTSWGSCEDSVSIGVECVEWFREFINQETEQESATFQIG